MIRHGLHPITLDKRDLSYHRTFGTVPVPVTEDFTVDIGKTMPDQNAEDLPEGCTGETQTDNKTDEDKTIYKPRYTYEKTCFMEGHDTNQGCQIRTSLKCGQVYGYQALAEDSDTEAEQHRGGQYFQIYDDGGLDWYDGTLKAVKDNKKGASVGTPWFRSWEFVNSTGILSMPTANELQTAKSTPFSLAWHNYSVKGRKTIDGVPYLIVKSWQGPNYGDRGWCYMTREIYNTILEIRGAGAFIQSYATPGDAKTIQVTIWETIMVFLNRIIGLKRLN